MGQSPSKRKHLQQNVLPAPYGYIYGPALPHNLGQGYLPNPPPVVPAGFMQPQGFVPNYPHVQMQMPIPIGVPQPYVWPIQPPVQPDRPKKQRTMRRRGNSGHRREPAVAQTQSSVPTSAHAPVTAPVVPPTHPQGGYPVGPVGGGSYGAFGVPTPRPIHRRSQTPFHVPQPLDPEDEQESEDGETRNPIPQPTNRTQPQTEPQVPRPSAEQRSTPASHEPATATAQRAPSMTRSSAPPRPLPTVPPFLFDLPEYKQTVEKISQMPDIFDDLRAYVRTESPEEATTKKTKKGLFRIFSSKKSSKQQPPQRSQSIQIPVHTGRVLPSVHRRGASVITHAAPPQQTQPVPQASIPIPVPPSPLPGPQSEPILFNQDTEHAGLLNHSPFRVRYEGQDYPTALHLLESLKFLPHRQDIAAQIRACEDISDVYPLAATHMNQVDPNWSTKFLEALEKVMYLKVTQHANLRSLLLSTGNAHLIYDDPSDSYWGQGPDNGGDNVLGTILERVRVRLLGGAVD